MKAGARRPRTSGCSLLVLLLVALVALVSCTWWGRPNGVPSVAQVQFNADGAGVADDITLQPATMAKGLAGFLGDLQLAVQPLQRQVDNGDLVPKFGQKAGAICADFAGKADNGTQLERVVDGVLHTLFLRQLVLLRQQVALKFEKAHRPVEAVAQADRQFVIGAEELKRPGSDWSFEVDRYFLRAVLEGTLRRDAVLEQERMLASRTQQSTVEIVSKLQSQMESLQQKVQAMRAGSPWFLSTSYRIPRTPFQLIGRYQQGRANLELSLNPDRDPANSEAGFVQGFGPMNLGVNLNLGM